MPAALKNDESFKNPILKLMENTESLNGVAALCEVARPLE